MLSASRSAESWSKRGAPHDAGRGVEVAQLARQHAVPRRKFLQSLAAAVAAGCHGGQGTEPVHPPVTGSDSKGEATPEALAPPVARIRDFALAPGTAPAIVFRALEPGKR